MTCTLKLQNNIRNGFPILDNPTKVLSFMLYRALLVLKLLKCPTPDGGHLGFVQYGRHRGSPSWLPREIGRRWSYLSMVENGACGTIWTIIWLSPLTNSGTHQSLIAEKLNYFMISLWGQNEVEVKFENSMHNYNATLVHWHHTLGCQCSSFSTYAVHKVVPIRVLILKTVTILWPRYEVKCHPNSLTSHIGMSVQ